MARVDDYREARRLAAEALSRETREAICARSGFAPEEGGGIRVPFLDRTYRLGLPGFGFADAGDPGREVPLQEQVLILHYLQGQGLPVPSGEWIAYREIPGAGFYYSAFVKRAIDPLKKVFGHAPERLVPTAAKIGGRGIDAGDAAFEIAPFPRIPLQYVLHAADEEFPAEASILFDRTVDRYLSPEDAAWLAGMVVYRMIALSR